jgi:microcystin-dependent protein
MQDAWIGEIALVSFGFAPVGWAMCNGQILQISQNTALFSLIGTTYGGDGVRTFALPDLRSRVPLHLGQGTGLSPYVLGQVLGNETVTLTIPQMPSHTHAYSPQATSDTGTSASPAGGAVWAGASGLINIYSRVTPNTTMSPQTITPSGGSQPHENRQPLLALNFIIALQGIYPSRN